MGKLSDSFAANMYRNEADVVQRFLRPVLTEFLGYREEEVLPEHSIPALQIATTRRSRRPSDGLRARPDFLLSLDGGATFVGACDAKAPTEDPDRHLDQVRAYVNALHTTNLILLTNGSRTKLLHGNTCLIDARSVHDLDLALEQLQYLFGRDQVAKLSERERIISLGAIAKSGPSNLPPAHQQRNAVDVSDFTSYLSTLTLDQNRFNLPASLLSAIGGDTAHITARELHRFRKLGAGRDEAIDLSALLATSAADPLLVVGESGIGKSVLLRDICHRQAEACLEATSNQLPILLPLRLYSAASSIEAMAQQRLTPNSATLERSELRKLMSEGRIMLLLDAFDEVHEESQALFERDLANILDAFPRTRVILSTRPQFRPGVGRLLAFQIDQLDQERTTVFLAGQSGVDPQLVLAHLRSTQLERLASNTLLLSLICVQLKRGQKLPRTRSALLQATLKLVEENEAAKPARSRPRVAWATKMHLLAQLAVLAIGNGAAYTLDRSVGDARLRRSLDDLELRREVPSGMSIADVSAALASTGFLVVESSNYAFWHRSFAEHFAAAELAASLDGGTDDVRVLAGKSQWRNVMADAVCRSRRVGEHLESLARTNIFLAGEALAELPPLDAGVVDRITNALNVASRSTYPSIRRTARNTLSSISLSTVEDMLANTIGDEAAPFATRFWSLTELARRNPERARPLVEARLTWDAFDDLEFQGAQEAIADSLGAIGSEWAQRTLLQRWMEREETWFGAPIARNFARLARSGTIDSVLGSRITSWFCSDDIKYPVLCEVGKVLTAMNTDTVASAVASRIRSGWHEKDKSHSHEHTRILESLTVAKAVEEIVAGLDDTSLSMDIHRRFGEALGHSAAPISVAILTRFAANGDLYVRSQALRRLSRLGWHVSESVTVQALEECRNADAATSTDLEFLQARAVDALVEHDRLDILVSPQFAQHAWFRLTLFCLLDALIARPRQGTTELVLRFHQVEDPRLRARVAVVLAACGRLADARAMRDELLIQATGKDYVESDLLQVSGSMAPSDALEWAREVWARSGLARESMAGFMFGQYCETLERIGTREATEELEALALAESEYEAMSALLHLEHIATNQIQDWTIQLAGIRRSTLIQRWCARILGTIGDSGAMDFLERRLGDVDPIVRARAFESLMRIHEREGSLWFGGEEVLGVA